MASGRSVFDGGFVNEHYRDVVADRVNTFTLDALQRVPIRLQLNFCLTSRTREYFQKFLTNCHGLDLSQRQFLREMLKAYHKGRSPGVRRPGAAFLFAFASVDESGAKAPHFREASFGPGCWIAFAVLSINRCHSNSHCNTPAPSAQTIPNNT